VSGRGSEDRPRCQNARPILGVFHDTSGRHGSPSNSMSKIDRRQAVIFIRSMVSMISLVSMASQMIASPDRPVEPFGYRSPGGAIAVGGPGCVGFHEYIYGNVRSLTMAFGGCRSGLRSRLHSTNAFRRGSLCLRTGAAGGFRTVGSPAIPAKSS
jgi:hypothetical protein